MRIVLYSNYTRADNVVELLSTISNRLLYEVEIVLFGFEEINQGLFNLNLTYIKKGCSNEEFRKLYSENTLHFFYLNDKLEFNYKVSGLVIEALSYNNMILAPNCGFVAELHSILAQNLYENIRVYDNELTFDESIDLLVKHTNKIFKEKNTKLKMYDFVIGGLLKIEESNFI